MNQGGWSWAVGLGRDPLAPCRTFVSLLFWFAFCLVRFFFLCLCLLMVYWSSMVSQNSKPAGCKAEPRYRRYGGGCASSILEADGPTEWKSLEEFSEYLRTWQGRNNVELVYWDSKRSKAYNTSNKLNEANPKYLHDSISRFAYKAWVCVHGRRGAKNPCRFP